jgi:hypothetical protein
MVIYKLTITLLTTRTTLTTNIKLPDTERTEDHKNIYMYAECNKHKNDRCIRLNKLILMMTIVIHFVISCRDICSAMQ